MCEIYDKLNNDLQEKIDRVLWTKHKASIKKDMLRGLWRFFYENQYDDERFPTFRACDVELEPDFEETYFIDGTVFYEPIMVYTFYDDYDTVPYSDTDSIKINY
jgi:ADP-heptose:LPS heptosyltransferase